MSDVLISDDPLYEELYDVRREAMEIGNLVEEDMNPYMNALRNSQPVHKGYLRDLLKLPTHYRHAAGQGKDGYTCFTYKACEQAFRDGESFSVTILKSPAPNGERRLAFLEMDDPEHRSHRAVMQPMFVKPRTLGWWRHRWINDIVNQLVERLKKQDRAELNIQLCARVPVHTITRAVGMEGDNSLEFRTNLLKTSSHRPSRRGTRHIPAAHKAARSFLHLPIARASTAARHVMISPSPPSLPRVNPPETRFAIVGDDRVAWQQLGNGPRDVVIASGLWSHLDLLWEEPATAAAFQRMASYCRLIRYDRRGSGLSDQRPVDGSMTDHWIEDLNAVIDAAGAQSPILLAIGDTGALVLKFYARFPERCGGLMLIYTSAGLAQAPDYPEGHSAEVRLAIGEGIRTVWGREDADPAANAGPSNPAQTRFLARLQRAMASPKAVLANLEATGQIDSRDVLPQVAVPTLIVTRSELTIFTAPQARYMARHIANARFEELPGNPRIAWEDAERLLQLIEEFVTGQFREAPPRRVLATLLMTDIVDSTRQLAKLGDAAWRARLDLHDRAVREQIERHGGRLVDTAGDGTLVQFDTPRAAIECAAAMHLAMAEVEIVIRAGIHFGEIELRDEGRIGGMAVHIAARVLGRSDGGETWVSRTVRDVLIGSEYRFKERGVHDLKGVPSKWPLYAVLP